MNSSACLRYKESMVKHSAAALLVAGAALAGCGASDEPVPSVPLGSAISYGSFGTTADIDCGAGNSLNIGGSNNTLNVVGACSSVSVGGADNKVTIARIDGELSVLGINNTVSYREGEPAVNDEGAGNRISRR